jgi:hypothetical protein
MFDGVRQERDRDAVLKALWRVHNAAQSAVRVRQAVVEAMARARRLGATDEEIADASGLSVRAVGAYIDQYYRRRRTRGLSETVGRPPPRPDPGDGRW